MGKPVDIPRGIVAERTRLLYPNASPPSRPTFLRKLSAPAAMDAGNARRHVESYFSFPAFGHKPPPTVAERLEQTEERIRDEIEAGCLRMAVRGIKWWLWHRWRR